MNYSCGNCKYCDFDSRYVYPFKCLKNKTRHDADELHERIREGYRCDEFVFKFKERDSESDMRGEEMIEPLNTEIGEWIPCSKRLPDRTEYGEVLVTLIPSAGTLWNMVMIAQYSDLMGIAKPSFHIGDVGKINFENITKQVTAWMPLPEPYSGADMRGDKG